MTEIQRIRKAIFEASGMSSNDAVSDVTSLIRVLRQEQAKFDFRAHIQRQRAFSQKTFGPGQRVKGLCSHIRKELREIEKAPTDLEEWIDVIILALDGAWRAG